MTQIPNAAPDRDLQTHPYTACEQRVNSVWPPTLQRPAASAPGPIGFLIASHTVLSQDLRRTRDGLKKLTRSAAGLLSTPQRDLLLSEMIRNDPSTE